MTKNLLLTAKFSSNTKPTITNTELNKLMNQLKVFIRQKKELIVEIKTQ